MEVEMKIRGLMMDPVTNMPIVILRDVSGNAVLPIWVGVYEANAIALEIEKVSTPRPMTHDLIKSLLLGLNTDLRKVVVSELKDDTFYAVIWLDREGELISVDSRPSDALALALRLDCPIYVEEAVLKSSKLGAAVPTRSTTKSCGAGWRASMTRTSADIRCESRPQVASRKGQHSGGCRDQGVLPGGPRQSGCAAGAYGLNRQHRCDDCRRPGVSGMARGARHAGGEEP
jgi:bifunctional DNase/RNase